MLLIKIRVRIAESSGANITMAGLVVGMSGWKIIHSIVGSRDKNKRC